MCRNCSKVANLNSWNSELFIFFFLSFFSQLSITTQKLLCLKFVALEIVTKSQDVHWEWSIWASFWAYLWLTLCTFLEGKTEGAECTSCWWKPFVDACVKMMHLHERYSIIFLLEKPGLTSKKAQKNFYYCYVDGCEKHSHSCCGSCLSTLSSINTVTPCIWIFLSQ